MFKRKNFWQKLPKPFSVLAPMADVTDPPFRRIIAKYGKPDVFYTQFVSCDGLCSAGYSALVKDLGYTIKERPIVAQFFGANPDNFYSCAKMAKKLGFDGIDINMGCPDKNVMKQRAGAALISNKPLAKEIIKATKAGAGNLPVSVKTRIGDINDELDKWIPSILSESPEVIIVHARTRRQMSKVPANWKYVAKSVELAKGSNTLIVGNGDAQSLSHGNELAKKTGADGIMYGRAIFGNPWFFNKKVSKDDVTISDRIKVLNEHTQEFEKYFKERKNFATMKKHFKSYVEGFPEAKKLRSQLMDANNSNEVNIILNEFNNTLT